MKKVYVITDMEGVAGVNGWHECRPAPDGSDADFERSRHLLSDEVAAAVLGARDGGAGDVLVLDGHRSGDNFIAERLPEGARYVMGRGRPNPLDGLDGTFDGVILLGYHSMAGTPGGLLAHTMSAGTWKRFSVNGITLGEIGMMALIAGSHDVPVWLVTGGRRACEEATALLGHGAAHSGGQGGRRARVVDHGGANGGAPHDPRGRGRGGRRAAAGAAVHDRSALDGLAGAGHPRGCRSSGDPVETADRRPHFRGVDRLHRRPAAALLGQLAAGRARVSDRRVFRIPSGVRS